MSEIVAPHENPDERKAKLAKMNLLFEALKKVLPKHAEMCVESSKQLQEGIRQIYINGMSDALVSWSDMAKAKIVFMRDAQNMMMALSEWEKAFIEWQKEVHGEEMVKLALKEAYERAN